MIGREETIEHIAQRWISDALDMFNGTAFDASNEDQSDDLIFIIGNNVDLAFDIIRRIAFIISQEENVKYDKSASDRMLGMLGAGDFEDLLHANPNHIIDKIEEESSRNSAFRRMLQASWRGNISDSIWSRIQIAALR